MSKVYIGNKRYKMYHGNKKVKKAYIGATRVYSAGNICTYHVTSGTVYQEEVDEGASCLSPTSFTPSLSGWTFVGWRKDTTASATVLTGNAVLMGDDPIHLYAVFRQTITISYSGNGNTGGSTASQTGYRYYNNGNIYNPTFTLRSCGFIKTGYVFDKWSNGGTAYSAGQTITASSNMTMIATYLIEEVKTTWDKLLVYPWPSRSWTGYKYVYEPNGLASAFADGDYTEAEVEAWDECWIASPWIDADGDHAGNYTNCLKANVDTSKYKGIKVPLELHMNEYYDDKGACNLYLSGGGKDELIAQVGQSVKGYRKTETFTLLFSQTSGNTNILLHNTRPNDSKYVKCYAKVAGDPILLRR